MEDFIHKFKVCLKELRESQRWLRLIKRVPLIKPESQVDALMSETEELIRIFKRSVQTASRRKLASRASDAQLQSPEFDVQRSTFRS